MNDIRDKSDECFPDNVVPYSMKVELERELDEIARTLGQSDHKEAVQCDRELAAFYEGTIDTAALVRLRK